MTQSVFSVSRNKSQIFYSIIKNFTHKYLVNRKYFISLTTFKKKITIFFFLIVIQMGVIVFIYKRSDGKFTK